MSEKDYKDILDQNVDEAKKSIEELEDPNYKELLEAEKDGRNRKTIKEFLQPKVDSSNQTEETEEDTETFTEQSNSFLEGYSRNQILSGGLVGGLLLGLILGFGFTMTDSPQVTPDQVEDSLMSLFEATGEEDMIEITDVTETNGMYYASMEVTAEVENETQTQEENFYVSPDGQLLFPEIQDMMMQNPINIEETIQQMEQMPEEDMMEEPGDQELELDEEDIQMEEPEGEELELEEEDLQLE